MAEPGLDPGPLKAPHCVAQDVTAKTLRYQVNPQWAPDLTLIEGG